MVKAILSSQKTTDVLPLSGGTMTGPITLDGAPTNDLHASTKKYVDDAKAAAESKATSALNDAKSYTDEKTAGLTGAMHFRGTVTSIPPSGSYVSGDVVLNGNKEYVYDGKNWKELGDEGSYVLKTQKVNNHALSGDISLTAADVGAATKSDITSAIAALDVAAVGGAGKYVSGISEVDGKIAATVASMPTTMKNPAALTAGAKSYDGASPVTITAADIGARPDSWVPSALEVGAVPSSGGTFTGDIEIQYPHRIRVRHVDGANDAELYLNYNCPNSPIYFGNGGHSINSNGSQYSGNAASANVANSANTAQWASGVLSGDTSVQYGLNGLQYFNIDGTSGTSPSRTYTPTTNWWHIIRCNHGNPVGFYTDLAIPFNDSGVHYRRVLGGGLADGGWVRLAELRDITDNKIYKRFKDNIPDSGLQLFFNMTNGGGRNLNIKNNDYPLFIDIQHEFTNNGRKNASTPFSIFNCSNTGSHSVIFNSSSRACISYILVASSTTPPTLGAIATEPGVDYAFNLPAFHCLLVIGVM